jgi:hypothetical protein
MCHVWRIGIGVFGFLLSTAPLGLFGIAHASASLPALMIDPEIRREVSAGRSRVLVELRVESTDPGAITAAQDRVLRNLPETHATLIRRYTSVPLLALDVDAEGLRVLERLTDAVVQIRADGVKRPQ